MSQINAARHTNETTHVSMMLKWRKKKFITYHKLHFFSLWLEKGDDFFFHFAHGRKKIQYILTTQMETYNMDGMTMNVDISDECTHTHTHRTHGDLFVFPLFGIFYAMHTNTYTHTQSE